MASAYQNLGTVEPAAATDTTLYTVPASTEAVVSTITVCNTSAAAVTIRLSMRPAGDALATKHYFVYELGLASSETRAFTFGIAMATTDVLTIRSSAIDVAFNAYGVEIT